MRFGEVRAVFSGTSGYEPPMRIASGERSEHFQKERAKSIKERGCFFQCFKVIQRRILTRVRVRVPPGAMGLNGKVTNTETGKRTVLRPPNGAGQEILKNILVNMRLPVHCLHVHAQCRKLFASHLKVPRAYSSPVCS